MLQLMPERHRRALFYLNMNSPFTIRQVSPSGGDEVVVLKGGVALGQWAVTRDGIVFVTMGREYDALDFYAFSDRRVRRLGQLPDKVSRIGGVGQFGSLWMVDGLSSASPKEGKPTSWWLRAPGSADHGDTDSQRGILR